MSPDGLLNGTGYDFFDKGFAVKRLTLGLNVGLNVDYMNAELRFNYEYFAKKNELAMNERKSILSHLFRKNRQRYVR
jgi:hypothetical protein